MMAAEGLPVFSGRGSSCPKCGGVEPSFRWQPAGTRFVSQADHGALIGYGEGPEWMLRECRDCDYTWPEACPVLDPAQRVDDLQREIVNVQRQRQHRAGEARSV